MMKAMMGMSQEKKAMIKQREMSSDFDFLDLSIFHDED